MNNSFQDIKLPSNKKFGFFFSIVFLISSAYFFYFNFYLFMSYVLITLSLLFFIISIFKANLLEPLNKLWMYLGLLLGMIIGPIIMSLIYFIIFVPIGIMMRLFKRDELNLKTTNLKSYWKNRDYRFDKDSFEDQF